MNKNTVAKKSSKPVDEVAFKKGEMPHLGSRGSQCGQRAYLRLEDAVNIGAKVCWACGLYHLPQDV